MRITKPTERWFPCPDDPDGGKILIRQLLPGERQDIFDDTMPTKTEYEKVKDKKGNETGDLVPVFTMEQNRAADRELTLKACVVNWENFFDENGESLECTHENIIRASREMQWLSSANDPKKGKVLMGFSDFVAMCRTQLDKDVKTDREGQEKNL